ncbi:MAG: hypothetical protein LBD02_03045 [Christensenellaceae bacterium]|nr:hypothetical protein [Christensenellaceae bacterium]
MKNEKIRLALGTLLLVACLALIGPLASFAAFRGVDAKLAALALGFGLAAALWLMGLLKAARSWLALLLAAGFGLWLYFYGYVWQGGFAPIPSDDQSWNPTTLPMGPLAGFVVGVLLITLIRSLFGHEKQRFSFVELSALLALAALACLQATAQNAVQAVFIKLFRQGLVLGLEPLSLLLPYLFGLFFLPFFALFFAKNRPAGLCCAALGALLCLINLFGNQLFPSLLGSLAVFLPPMGAPLYAALLFGGLQAAAKEP